MGPPPLHSLLLPCYVPVMSLFRPCSEFAPARRKGHGIKSLNACKDQKREISPVIFPDHGNLANPGDGVRSPKKLEKDSGICQNRCGNIPRTSGVTMGG